MKTLAEQLEDLINTRAAKVAQAESVMKKAMEEGRSTDDAEAEDFDTLQREVKQLDLDIARYDALVKMQAGTALPVASAPAAAAQSQFQKSQAPLAFVKKQDPDDKFEGQSFTRMVIAKAEAKIRECSPIRVAEERWGKTHPNLVQVIKADVAGGGSGSGEWGAELVTQDRYTNDFQEFLYGMTVYNRLPLREVPANINIAGQDGAATGYWVGESKAIPVSKLDFNDVNLTPLKVAALAVISKELIRDSSPSAEMLVRDGLMEAAAQRIDTTFVGVAAGTSGTTPAGVLYNVPGTSSAGTDYDSILNDLKELDARFIASKNTSGQFFYLMNPLLASAMSFIRNALDQQPFSTVNAQGGTLSGQTVITGDNVNANYLIKIKPSDIYRIGMGNMEVSMSDQASIEMESSPAADTDTPTAPTGKVVSMYQTESMAIKLVQSMNFARRRDSAVAWIKDADYGGNVST